MSRPSSDPSNSETFQQPRSRNRRFFVLGFLFVMALLVLFAPAILVNTPLKQTALDYAFSDVQGDVQVANVSIGWFSPVRVENIVVADEIGNEVITIESLTTSNRLMSLLSGTDLGQIEIVRPTFDVNIRPDGSNIEDIFTNYINAPTTDTESAIRKVQIEIVDGMARLRSESVSQIGVVEKFSANIDCMTDSAPLIAKMQCQISTNPESIGNVFAEITIDQGQPTLTGNSIIANLQTEQLSIDSLAPIATRILGPVNSDGSVDCDLAIEYQSDTESVGVNVTKFNGRQIAVVAPEYIGSDQFIAHNLNASGSLEIDTTHISANQFKIESEFAQVNANGQFDVEQLIQLANGSAIPQSNFQFDGAVDLAQVVAMLPETARIRDGVSMKSGILQFTANTRDEHESQRIVLNAEAVNMQFNINGQNVVWNQPLRAVCVAGETNGSLSLEEVQLQSDFLTVAGFATFDRGRFQVNGDLEKVISQVGQIVDTAGLSLGGQINGELGWTINGDKASTLAENTHPIRIDGTFKITDPRFAFPGMSQWSEKELDFVIGGDGLAAMGGPVAIQNGSFEIQLGNETAKGVLAKPIENVLALSKLQFNCHANGSIAKWIAQARNFSEFPEFFIDGNLNSQFLLTLNSESVRLNQIQFEARDFEFEGFALNIREPEVTGRANLKYDLATGNVAFSKSRLNSPSIAVNTDQWLLTLSEKILADGVVTFRGNANRLSQWIGLSMPSDSVRWDGTAIGKMTFDSKSNYFGGELAGKITDLVLVQPVAATTNTQPMQNVGHQRAYAEFWREPDVRVLSTFMLSDDFNNVQINSLNIKSKTADFQANGTISQLDKNMMADLAGQWNVKWDDVNQTLRELAGEVVNFQGDGWQPIQIKGPLYDGDSNYAWIPDQLSVSANLNWQQAKVLDMPIGSSQVDVRLNQSLANLSSRSNSSLVDKFFQLQPVVDLKQADPILKLGQGILLDQWNITAEDSRTWLKYAAPLVADATSAEGKLTAKMNGATVPLFNPLESTAQGALEIHHLNIGPGPLAQQLLPLVDQILAVVKPGGNSLQDRSSWMQLKPQRLPFAVQQGRVHHQGFEMNYKDVTVRTRGSVGFDQSLDMVAEIPILENWIGNDKMLKRLIGKTISIPVTGTLSTPRLDRQAITQLTRQLIRDSAIGAVNEKVASEVGEFQDKVGDKVQGELNRFQDKVNDKMKSEFEDKVQDELKNGFNKLFGNGKK